MKYFNFKPTEDNLRTVEAFGKELNSLESALANLRTRETQITDQMNPPKFITRHYGTEFMNRTGVHLPVIDLPYPRYKFEYVSAGGNSAQQTTLVLDTPAVDAMVSAMSERIRFRKSAAGQRALMTSTLRNQIKSRDNFACRICGLSTRVEPNLLLEVDHIVPLSRGGMTCIENLQTLCWRCNRSKGNKMPDRASTPRPADIPTRQPQASVPTAPTLHDGEDSEPGYRPPRQPFVAPPDWHPDPSGAPNVFRYWDGYRWTDLTRQHP